MCSSSDLLEKLADLMEEYRAEIRYTTRDDGIHVTVDGCDVFVGFIDGDSGPDELRQAAKELRKKTGPMR